LGHIIAIIFEASSFILGRLGNLCHFMPIRSGDTHHRHYFTALIFLLLFLSRKKVKKDSIRTIIVKWITFKQNLYRTFYIILT